MFDRSKFLDIEPYGTSQEAEAACSRVRQHPEFVFALATALFPGADEASYAQRKWFTGAVLSRLEEVHCYDDFQKKITCDVFLDNVILKYTVGDFSYNGQEKLDPKQSYLFVSNHRDIVLDCALLDLALFRSGVPICEMAIGDNLLTNSFIEDIFKLNGAIIVKSDEIISTGYNGAPRGRKNCVDLGYCAREALKVPRGERYELCRSVHAEANAIISASRRDMVGGTLYLVGRDARTGELLGDATSCSMCRRLVINAGLKEVVIRRTATEFDVVDVADWVAEDDLLAPRDADAILDRQ